MKLNHGMSAGPTGTHNPMQKLPPTDKSQPSNYRLALPTATIISSPFPFFYFYFSSPGLAFSSTPGNSCAVKPEGKFFELLNFCCSICLIAVGVPVSDAQLLNNFVMEEARKVEGGGLNVNGFSPASSTPVFWKSRRRSVGVKKIDKEVEGPGADNAMEKQKTSVVSDADKSLENLQNSSSEDMQLDPNNLPNLSEKRKALFEPLDPVTNINGKRPSAESLLPPPDFESASYPRGWLIGKKRKLVNVDVVESMRRIAVQEMNRKDREIDGLNEQLEEDARCLEHLQIQLLEERSKRTEVERQNTMLQNQITMLMDMLQENEPVEDEDEDGFDGTDQGP